MRIALISDIHSNFTYFQTIVPLLEEVDQVFCLGDVIGYYDKPNEVIEVCMGLGIRAVKGNHEKYLLREKEYQTSKDHIYGIARQRDEIEKKHMEWLEGLPDFFDIVIGGKAFYMTHSLPGDQVTYLSSPNKLDRSFTSRYDFYCSGHTHIPSVQYSFGTCFVNPGSIGQPRDYTGKPSFVVVDLLSDACLVQKKDVDREGYKARLEHQKIDKTLIDILGRGNNE
jgi:putative phosphoesterase